MSQFCLLQPNHFQYKQILEIIEEYKPKSFIEVGTWNAGRAIEMALTAFKHHDEILYKGFDLFEDATTETDIEEFNVKAHNTKSAVMKRLKDQENEIMHKVLDKEKPKTV